MEGRKAHSPLILAALMISAHNSESAPALAGVELGWDIALA